MSIKYEPSKIIKRIAPAKKIEKLLTRNLTVNKAALSFVNDVELLDRNSIAKVALKVAKNYKERIKNETATKSELLDDKKLLIQRVQNEVVKQIGDELKDRYSGEKYTWLPSDAEVPDPEHQLNYGKTFIVGDGEMPGDRDGCKCGMDIKTDDTKLEL